MSAQDFLVELGTEELPPKALNTLATRSSPVSTKACKPA
jgi:glycyl-tRNA synthetase beta subunit